MQVEFISWCHFYHNIYSDEERPDNATIDDDAALDGWLAKRRMDIRKQQIMAKRDREGITDFGTDGKIRKESDTFTLF